MKNVKNVKQFGAKGDGFTDDSTALANAILCRLDLHDWYGPIRNSPTAFVCTRCSARRGR